LLLEESELLGRLDALETVPFRNPSAPLENNPSEV
jgi:hypothetical protein